MKLELPSGWDQYDSHITPYRYYLRYDGLTRIVIETYDKGFFAGGTARGRFTSPKSTSVQRRQWVVYEDLQSAASSMIAQYRLGITEGQE